VATLDLLAPAVWIGSKRYQSRGGPCAVGVARHQKITHHNQSFVSIVKSRGFEPLTHVH